MNNVYNLLQTLLRSVVLTGIALIMFAACESDADASANAETLNSYYQINQ